MQPDPPQNSLDPGVRPVTPKIHLSELRFVSVIAQGIFGQVYKGICRDEPVAIKELFGIQMNAQVARDFLHEVQIMTSLSHKNVLRLHGCCTETQMGQNNWYLVVEWMERGSLTHVLQNKEIILELEQQVQFGIDIASGMNWLHSASPQILHRDLKPDNVLVDKDWNCKVSDFGLSEINRQRRQKQDQGNAPGSVLWMAPEVLTGGLVDSKLDIYAFGLVLWEIISRQMVFNDYTDKAIFTYDIVQKRVRPNTGGMPEPLVNIMTVCWDHNPNQRPTFAQIIPMLQNALVDCFLPVDTMENKFWKSSFGAQTKVPLNNFLTGLFQFLGWPNDQKLSPIVAEFLTLSTPYNNSNTNNNIVTFQKFKNLLHWFGPLRHPSGKTILHRIFELLTNPYFFGPISAELAEATLSKCNEGAFLVRMNLGGNKSVEETPFTIVRKNANGPADHIRIYPKYARNADMMETGRIISYCPSGYSVKFDISHKNQRNQSTTPMSQPKSIRTQTQRVEDVIERLFIQEPYLFIRDTELPKSKYHTQLSGTSIDGQSPKFKYHEDTTSSNNSM